MLPFSFSFPYIAPFPLSFLCPLSACYEVCNLGSLFHGIVVLYIGINIYIWKSFFISLYFGGKPFAGLEGMHNSHYPLLKVILRF